MTKEKRIITQKMDLTIETDADITIEEINQIVKEQVKNLVKKKQGIELKEENINVEIKSVRKNSNIVN